MNENPETSLDSPSFYAVFIRRENEENGSSKESGSSKGTESSADNGPSRQSGSSTENGNSMVFTELKSAIKYMESKKGSDPRFQKFRNLSDAEKFCQNGPGIFSPSNLLEEPPIEFPMPKRNELVEFENFIRKNEIDRVELLIESNPCYLINAKIGDSPTVLKEGCNWNSLHIAAKNGRTEICLLILEKLNDRRFFFRLFPKDDEEMNKVRRDHMLKAYFQSRTQNPKRQMGSLEVPLHYAAKGGFGEIVEIFSNFQQCDKNATTKDGETPIHLAARCGHVKVVEILSNFPDVDVFRFM